MKITEEPQKVIAKKGIILIAAIIILDLTIITSGFLAYGHNKMTVTVEPGDGTIRIENELKRAGLIHERGLFRVLAGAKLMGSDWHQGTYTFSQGESYFKMLDTMTDPMLSSVKVTIPEGKQVTQIADILEENGVCDRDAFLYACKAHTFKYDFLNGIDTKTRKNGLEGYLFPDTYYFEKNSNPDDVIKIMLDNFGSKVYTKKIKTFAKSKGWSVDDVIILASMVESEATTKADRKDVAQVFEKRLQNPSAKLQSCVTVEYAKGIKKTVISLADTRYKSPYNTYLHAGLPYGPICCPSMESIDAVMNPGKKSYEYFVSDGKGKIYFSTTYEEHLRKSNALF